MCLNILGNYIYPPEGMFMEVNSKILVSFAKDFREEMEILSSRTLMQQIKRTRRAKKKGQLLRFNSKEDFLMEVRAK